jgi:hypothetical protein
MGGIFDPLVPLCGACWGENRAKCSHSQEQNAHIKRRLCLPERMGGELGIEGGEIKKPPQGEAAHD